MSAPFTYCDGCCGHDCDAERGCAYPGIVPRPAPTVEPVAWRNKATPSSILSPAEYKSRLPLAQEWYEPLYSAATFATANARIAGLEKALAEIARQKKTDELDTEYDVEMASFEDGYDLCIDRARAALTGGEDAAP